MTETTEKSYKKIKRAKRREKCVMCQGRGREAFSGMPCSTCDGTGIYYRIVIVNGD